MTKRGKNLPKDAVTFLNGCSNYNNNVYLDSLRFSYCNDKKKVYPLSENKSSKISDELQELTKFLHNKNEQIMEIEFNNLAISYIYKLESRLLIGLGNSPFKIASICLHFTYGIPYIPASALKGALRNCWICEDYGGVEEEALKNDEFKTLFGVDGDDNQTNQGGLTFLDTYPIFTKDNLELMDKDVQTPHFKEYYNFGKKAPLDTIKPNPIEFRCLSNLRFKFHIGFKDANLYEKYHKKVEEKLDLLCTQYGIGAKTSIGYGIMHKEEKGN